MPLGPASMDHDGIDDVADDCERELQARTGKPARKIRKH